MTLTLKIPKDMEADLATEAARLGLSLSEYALRVLTTGRAFTPAPKNGAELVEYWKSEGVIGTRPEIKDSRKHSRKLRRKAERRRGK